ESVFFSVTRRRARSTLFPYTTLFRSRPLFQNMSYHDTPEKPLPKMEYVDTAVPPGQAAEYRVVAVNSVGLKSLPSDVAVAKKARSEEHTSELQSRENLVCRLLLEKKK